MQALQGLPGLPGLDDVWLGAAVRLGIPVVRGGEAYVHWDGRRLHLADPAHLDPDDTVAQLVLHEICHALVEGPAAFDRPDWGLDNTSDRDALREAACIRLQAHLLGAHGLRGLLFPTTEVRAFFESLPADALAPAGDPGVDLARQGAARAAQPPWQGPLALALAQTSALVGQARHPQSGWPLTVTVTAPGDSPRTCGGCAWRTAGGLCRQASRRARVDRAAPACVRWEAPLDCADCAACCRHAYDQVPVGPRDPVRRRHPDLVVVAGGSSAMARAGAGDSDRCAALVRDAAAGGRWACRIYPDRPRACRDFEVGGRHCLTARRRIGLTL